MFVPAFPSDTVEQGCPLLAAERRQNAAHGVSRGKRDTPTSPIGAKEEFLRYLGQVRRKLKRRLPTGRLFGHCPCPDFRKYFFCRFELRTVIKRIDDCWL